MEYRQLGNSSLLISRIGLGCMSLKPGEENREQIIQEAIENGINYFDTADLYDKGENEKLLGTALKGKRKDVIIATKVGNQWRKDGSGWDWNPTKAYILKAVDESLVRLGTEYIDLYQLHGGTIDDPVNETIEAFEHLVQKGKIRYYGISSIRPNVIRKWADQSNMISVMMQYGLLDRRPEESILSLLQEKNIGVLARGSLAQGLLVNKPPRDYVDHTREEVTALQEFVSSLASSSRKASDIAIQYALRHPAVCAAIVGTRTMQQLRDAIHSIQAVPLSHEEIYRLQTAIEPRIYKEHR